MEWKIIPTRDGLSAYNIFNHILLYRYLYRYWKFILFILLLWKVKLIFGYHKLHNTLYKLYYFIKHYFTIAVIKLNLIYK